MSDAPLLDSTITLRGRAWEVVSAASPPPSSINFRRTRYASSALGPTIYAHPFFLVGIAIIYPLFMLGRKKKM